jgi:glucose-1-phosphatase
MRAVLDPAGPTHAKRRPALIFDFGNVFSFFDYSRAADRLGSQIGVAGAAFLEQIRKLGLNPLVARYESGRMSSEEFGQAVCRLAGLELSFKEFVDAWTDIFWLNEPVVRLVSELKRSGYSLILGSNTNELHANRFRRDFADALAPFDELILSYEVGHIKPEAPFYLACARASGAPPAECVFIDDVLENVEGARRAGLMAIHYRDDPTLRQELLAAGVEVPAVW